MSDAVTVTLRVEAGGSDGLRSLHGWLADADGCRGRTRLIEKSPPPGALGPMADAVAILDVPVVALATALVAWIRSRYSDIDVTVTSPDGSTRRISAKRVRVGADRLDPVIEALIAEPQADPPNGQVEPGDAVAQ